MEKTGGAQETLLPWLFVQIFVNLRIALVRAKIIKR